MLFPDLFMAFRMLQWDFHHKKSHAAMPPSLRSLKVHGLILTAQSPKNVAFILKKKRDDDDNERFEK